MLKAEEHDLHWLRVERPENRKDDHSSTQEEEEPTEEFDPLRDEFFSMGGDRVLHVVLRPEEWL